MMLRVLAVTTTVAAATIIPAAPAAAADCGLLIGCGIIQHTKDDYYDPALRIECDNGNTTRHRVHEYQSSTDYCWDVRRVYVRPGEEIWCEGPYAWSDKKKMFDAQGWHKFPNGGYDCTLRVD